MHDTNCGVARAHSGLLGWLPGAAAVLAIILASCAGAGPPVETGAGSASMRSAPAPSPTAAAPSVVPVGTGSPAPAGTASTALGSPAAPAPTPGSAFTLVRMAMAADPALPAPDARTFVSSFPPKTPAMYVVFALRPGLTGTVVCTVTANGVQTVGPITLAYGPTNSWGDFRITSRGTFVVGSYRATLTLGPTRAVATVDFTVQ